MGVKTKITNKGIKEVPLSDSRLLVEVPFHLSSSGFFNNNNLTGVGTINGIDITTITGSAIPANVLLVAKAGGQYTTINSALSASSPGQVVLVYPGTYSESFSIPSNVKVSGFPTSRDVIVAGGSASGSRVVFSSGGGVLADCVVVGPTEGTDPAVDAESVITGIANLANVVFSGTYSSGSAIKGTGGGELLLANIFHNGGRYENFIEQINGNSFFDNILLNQGSCTSAIKISGSNAFCVAKQVSFVEQYSSAENGIELGTSATLQLNLFSSLEVSNPVNNAIFISGEAIELDIMSSHLHANSLGFFVDSSLNGSGTNVYLNGVDLKLEEFDAPLDWIMNATLAGTRLDTGVQNDRKYNIFTELSVGVPGKGSESSFGRGDSSVLGMVFISSSSAGGFIDRTSDLQNRTSGTANLFDQVSSGSVTYIGTSGSFVRKFHNIKLDINSVGVTGSGQLSFEYLSGNTGGNIWKNVNFMASDASFPYTQRDIRIFDNDNAKQIRFDIDEFDNWVTGTVGNSTGYFLRAKVSSSITTSPSLSRVKIGEHRTEINSDGFEEFFGRAEVQKLIPGINLGAVVDLVGATPANGPIDISSNINLRAFDNRFNSNATDGFGQLLTLPYGVDTSRKLTLRVGFYGTSDTAGAAQFQFSHTTQISDGFNINNGSNTEVTTIKNVSIGSNRSNLLQVVDFDFRLPRQDDKTLFAYSLKRNGSAGGDTYGGNIIIAFIECYGYFWN